MKIIRTVAILATGIGLFSGCGQAATIKTGTDLTASSSTTTTMAPPTTTTTAVPTTTTTCQAPTSALPSDQATLDSLIAGRRTAQSAVAQIQLTVDNAGRQVDIVQRYVTQAQTAYNLAAAAYDALPIDTNQNRLISATNDLANAKDVVASWEALRTTALGDLSRGKATLADWDKRISDTQRAVAADKASQNSLTCS